jgi:hypothetical protein
MDVTLSKWPNELLNTNNQLWKAVGGFPGTDVFWPDGYHAYAIRKHLMESNPLLRDDLRKCIQSRAADHEFGSQNIKLICPSRSSTIH